MKNLAKKILDLVFPPKCIVCDKFSVIENGICLSCFDKMEFISYNNACDICGFPFEIPLPLRQLCALCIVKSPVFKQSKSVFFYNDTSSNLIKKFKYQDKTELAFYFAKMMYNYDKNYFKDIDIITSVPLHWTRQIKRLYNQSSILSLHLAKLTNKIFLPSLVIRIKKTKPQFNLNTAQRKQNLKNAFQANMKYCPRIKNKNILLIDDVFTTGETINLVSKELIKLGAASVKIFTLARSKL